MAGQKTGHEALLRVKVPEEFVVANVIGIGSHDAADLSKTTRKNMWAIGRQDRVGKTPEARGSYTSPDFPEKALEETLCAEVLIRPGRLSKLTSWVRPLSVKLGPPSLRWPPTSVSAFATKNHG